jgi:hypothetical protein
MTRLSLRRFGLLLFTALAFALAGAGGCSRQGQGERCDFKNAGDADCDDGLVCVRKEELSLNDGADRCCPPVGQSISDSRCTRGTPLPSSSGGSSGAGGSTAGTTGAAGENAAGVSGEGGMPGGQGGEAGMSASGAGGA